MTGQASRSSERVMGPVVRSTGRRTSCRFMRSHHIQSRSYHRMRKVQPSSQSEPLYGNSASKVNEKFSNIWKSNETVVRPNLNKVPKGPGEVPEYRDKRGLLLLEYGCSVTSPRRARRYTLRYVSYGSRNHRHYSLLCVYRPNLSATDLEFLHLPECWQCRYYQCRCKDSGGSTIKSC